LFLIIDGSKKRKKQTISKKGTTLDIAPTIMDVLGFSINIGLGRNLFNENSLIMLDNRADKLMKENTKLFNNLENKKISILNVITLNTILYSWRDYFLSFWEFPILNQGLSILTKENIVKIGKKTMKYPVIFQIDKNARVFPKFSLFEKGRLKSNINKVPNDNSFLWIDDCRYMKKIINVKEKKKHICFSIGNLKNDEIYITEIKDNFKLSGEKFLSFLKKPSEGFNFPGIEKVKLSSILNQIDRNKIFTERCHSTNINPEDIIEKYDSNDTVILISAYHVDTNLVSHKFMDMMKSEKSNFVSLQYEDLYLGVIKNKKVLVEKNSSNKHIDLNYNIGIHDITIRTTGLDSLFKSSIIVNGLDVSPNYPGINLVVFNTTTGDIYTYNFPTYRENI
jgi:hypothetical protein